MHTTTLSQSIILNDDPTRAKLPARKIILAALNEAQARCSVNLLNADDVEVFASEYSRIKREAKKRGITDMTRLYVVVRGGYSANSARRPDDATIIALDGGTLTISRTTAPCRPYGRGPRLTSGIRGPGGGGLHGR